MRRGLWVVGCGSLVTHEYCVLRVLTLKSPHVNFEQRETCESLFLRISKRFDVCEK